MKSIAILTLCVLLSPAATWAGRRETTVMVVRTNDTPRSGALIFELHADGRIEPVAIRAEDFGGSLAYGSRRPLGSPDGSKIAYTVDGELWVHDLVYNATLAVTDVATPADGEWKSVFVTIKRWSPDSKRLIYRVSHDEFELGCEADPSAPTRVREAPYGFYVYDLGKLESRRLHEEERLADYLPVDHLAWLADGSFVVASSASPETTGPPIVPEAVTSMNHRVRGDRLYRVSADGKQFSYLGSIGGLPLQAAVSDDNSRLAALIASEDEQGKRYTQIVEFDLETGVSRPLAPRNRWDETRQWPRYRPGGLDVSYRLDSKACVDEGCHDREVRRLVVVGETTRGECAEALDFTWIDGRRMGLRCGDTLSIVAVESGKTLGSRSLDSD